MRCVTIDDICSHFSSLTFTSCVCSSAQVQTPSPSSSQSGVYVFSAKMENDDNTDEDEAKQEDVQEELSPSQKLKERFKDLWENPRELEACQ